MNYKNILFSLVFIFGCGNFNSLEKTKEYISVSVSHSKITAVIYNPTEHILKCSGKIVGFTTKGNVVKETGLKAIVAPFMDRRITIFTEKRKQIFKSGIARFACVKTKS